MYEISQKAFGHDDIPVFHVARWCKNNEILQSPCQQIHSVVKQFIIVRIFRVDIWYIRAPLGFCESVFKVLSLNTIQFTKYKHEAHLLATFEILLPCTKILIAPGYLSVSFQGGFEYKKAIVNTIIDIVEENSDAKESGLYFILWRFYNVITFPFSVFLCILEHRFVFDFDHFPSISCETLSLLYI